MAGEGADVTTLSFTPDSCEPYGAKLSLEFVSISRDVLRALVASAHHLTERYDVTLGNSATSCVEWKCRSDCPVCVAHAVLGEEGLL